MPKEDLSFFAPVVLMLTERLFGMDEFCDFMIYILFVNYIFWIFEFRLQYTGVRISFSSDKRGDEYFS